MSVGARVMPPGSPRLLAICCYLHQLPSEGATSAPGGYAELLSWNVSGVAAKLNQN